MTDYACPFWGAGAHNLNRKPASYNPSIFPLQLTHPGTSASSKFTTIFTSTAVLNVQVDLLRPPEA